MNLEKQVISLELGKKLKELRIKQESLFYWATYRSIGILIYTDHMDYARFSGFLLYSAFTATELGEMLPKNIRYHNELLSLKYYWDDYPDYYLDENPKFLDEEAGILSRIEVNDTDTSANARAKMLIYLIDNNLIEINNEYASISQV